MICRFCGKYISTIEKCELCLKDNPVILEYKSYKNDAIIKKLSVLLVNNSNQTIKYDDKLNHENKKNPLEEVVTKQKTSYETNSNDFSSQVIRDYNHKNKDIKNNILVNKSINNKNSILFISIVIVLLMLICLLLIKTKNTSNGMLDVDTENISTSTVDDTIGLSEEKFTTIETEENIETDMYILESDLSVLDIKGQYYSMYDSDYDKNSYDDFINIFGYLPNNCMKYLFIDNMNLNFDYINYPFSFENNILTLNGTNFDKIGTQFIDVFNFNQLTQSENYDNTDTKNNELFVFNIKDKKIDSVILCNKLNDLIYEKTEDLKFNTDGRCIFSITNNKKDFLYLFKDYYGNTSLKTSYRNTLNEVSLGNGNIIKENETEGYDIIRISLDGEKYTYFFRKYDDQSVYMIQYIKYNAFNNDVEYTISGDEEDYVKN